MFNKIEYELLLKTYMSKDEYKKLNDFESNNEIL